MSPNSSYNSKLLYYALVTWEQVALPTADYGTLAKSNPYYRGHIKKMIRNLEVCFDGEEELVNEDAFEGGDIVLLIEHQHGFLVIDGIYCTEGDRAVTVGNKYAVAYDACCALVAVGECLNVTE